MKKTVVTTCLALVFAVFSLQANNNYDLIENSPAETMVKAKVSAFCMAIVKGDIETVKKLIELGEDVNVRSNGLSPAMYAARYNKVDILKLLIEHEANLKVKCPKGYTALKYAQLSNATEAAEVLKKAMKKKKRAKV